MATFVGFVPADKPELVILALVDEPKGDYYGGVVAGPVFKEVGQWTLNYLGINPRFVCHAENLNENPDREDPASKKENSFYISTQVEEISKKIKEGILPNFSGLGMREVLKKGRTLDMIVRLEGTGLAVKQHPKAGVSLKEIDTIKVYFRPPSS